MEKNAQIFWLEDLKDSKGCSTVVETFRAVLASLHNCDFIFVSFDIDSIRQSDVPCVSCPSPVGLTSEEALEIMVLAGKERRVMMVDISEFNPEVCLPMSYCVGRLVANMFYSYLLGMGERINSHRAVGK